jgi:hypothetical protein
MQKQKIFLLSVTLVLLASSSWSQQPAKKDKQKTIAPAAASPVTGSGTPGRISKWAGVDGSNSFSLGNSNIFEDKFGKVGIGTSTPTSPLTVQGMIETTLGGVKFPDGTVQNSAFNPSQAVKSLNGLTGDVQLAGSQNITITKSGNTITVASPNALTTVVHDTTLTGNGTQASPLGVALPLEVRDPDNPARQPVQASISCTISNRFCTSDILTVPAGKRLVIEYASVQMQVNDPGRVGFFELTTRVNGTNVIHQLTMSQPSVGTLGDAEATVGQQVRIYADPGTIVSGAGRLDANSTGSFRFRISGHYVDIP